VSEKNDALQVAFFYYYHCAAIFGWVNLCVLTAEGSFTYCGGRLPALSRMFKDTVAYPLLQFAMQGQLVSLAVCVTTAQRLLTWPHVNTQLISQICQKIVIFVSHITSRPGRPGDSFRRKKIGGSWVGGQKICIFRFSPHSLARCGQ